MAAYEGGRREELPLYYFIVLRKVSRAINGIIEQFPPGLE